MAEITCKTHPDAPHGFDRNASHNADRYVCECENWEPKPVAHVYRIEANGRPCVAWDDASEIKVGAKLYAAPREWVGLTGMTLRDYFAAKAMQGLFSCGKAHDEHTAHVTAKASYLLADAMLKAREA